MMPIPEAVGLYKHLTEDFKRWLFETSISVDGGEETHDFAGNERPDTSTDLSTIPLSELVKMAQVLKDNNVAVRSRTFRRLSQAIFLRKYVYDHYSNLPAASHDPELIKGNEEHLHCIEALEEIFDILGGESWKLKQLPFTLVGNIFEILDLEELLTSDEEGNTGSLSAPETSESSNNVLDFALQGAGFDVDRGKAGLDILTMMVNLSHAIQVIWTDHFTPQGMSRTVAAGLTKTAVAMIKSAAIRFSINFGGLDSFREMLDIARRVNPQEQRLETSLAEGLEALMETYIAFQAFLSDYRKNGNGKPTKAMAILFSRCGPGIRSVNKTR